MSDQPAVTTRIHPVQAQVPAQGQACDLSTVCASCGSPMAPEHAHYRCPRCGWRDTCCDGMPL